MLTDHFRQEDIEYRFKVTLFFVRLPPSGDSEFKRVALTRHGPS
jgi:hypothetical protein